MTGPDATRLAPGTALYVGTIRHRRLRPRKHRLQYRVWHLLLDVDQVHRLHEDVKGFGHNRRAIVEFRDTDHFGPVDRPVREKLEDFLAGRGIELPAGRVLVLTYPRVLGHVFNPVSFWYCHDQSGRLALVVAEVNNTFGDSYSYVLEDLRDNGGGALVGEADKALHVSPFLPRDDHRYRFTLRPPTNAIGQTLAVQLDVHEPHGGRILDATLVEQRVALTTRSLRRVLWTHPLLTLHTVAAIHWQALRIWLGRKARFHRRPDPLPNGYPDAGASREARAEGSPDPSAAPAAANDGKAQESAA